MEPRDAPPCCILLLTEIAMRWFAAVPFFSFLLITAFLYNAPLILIVRLARTRLGRIASRSLIATGFAVSTGYWLWRVEWFDIWRHGPPAARYLLFVYAPYLAGAAALGWLVGTFIVPTSSRTRRAF
jgi:hypothetical protein